MAEDQQIPGGVPSAFTPEFVEHLRSLEDVPTAQEAELAGPWKVVRTSGGYRILRTWERPELMTSSPGFRFDHPRQALVFSAVLPAVARSPLYRFVEVPSEDGSFLIESEGQILGRAPRFHPELLFAAHVGDWVARSPLSLARLFEAAGPTAQILLGQILGQQAR